MEGQRRPKANWAQFLEFAPDFISVMWCEDQCFTEDFAPLVRAVAFYDNFEARVTSDGLRAYFRFGELVPHFDSAPDIVAKHHLLSEIGDLIREAFANKTYIADVVRADSVAEQLALAQRYQDFEREFHDRAWSLLETLRPKINREILENLEAYITIEPPPGLIGAGEEFAEIPIDERVWRIRFLDGFPIGPSVSRISESLETFVHFSSDRMRIEFDRFGRRRWIDFRTGQEGDC